MTKLNLYSKEQVDALNIGKETDTASATGSLWARIKNALSRLTTAESNITSLGTSKANDNAVVKLTGDQNINGVKTFSNEAKVPSIPTSYLDAVNSAYVNNANSTVNNIVHKDGTAETVTSEKTFTKTIISSRDSIDQYQLINILKKYQYPDKRYRPCKRDDILRRVGGQYRRPVRRHHKQMRRTYATLLRVRNA